MADQAGPRNLVLETIAEALAGKADPTRLAEVLALARKELQETRLGFTQGVESLQPAVRKAADESIGQALIALDASDNALNILEEYLQTGDRRSLLRAEEQVRRCAYSVSFTFSAVRSVALAAAGPTDIPNLNLLLQVRGAVESGRVPMSELAAVAEREAALAKQALEKIGESPKTAEFEELRGAYEQHEHCMRRLAAAAREGNDGGTSSELEIAHGTFKKVRDLMPAATASARYIGPTPSKQVNLVLSLAKDLQRGAINEDFLVDALKTLEQTMKGVRVQFEAGARSVKESSAVYDEVVRGRQALDLYAAAFEDFRTFFDRARFEDILERGMEHLEKGAKDLHAAQQAMLEIASREGKVQCFRCQHYNMPDRGRCEKCGQSLPVPQQAAGSTFDSTDEAPSLSASDEGPALTENFVRVYEAVNGVSEGKITVEEFLQTVDWFEKLVRTQVAAVPPQPSVNVEQAPPGDDRELAEVLVSTIEEGAELFNVAVGELERAIAAFRQYAADGNQVHLEEGLKACKEGARELREVSRGLAVVKEIYDEARSG